MKMSIATLSQSSRTKNDAWEVVTVTPDMAREWLKYNKVNRPLSQAWVNYYVRQIVDGLWDGQNGQSIKFDVLGNLIDGQHRLYAIIASGIAVTLEVRRHLKTESFKTIDVGNIRTAAHTLAALGIKNYALVAAVGRLIWLWRHGQKGLNSRVSIDEIVVTVRKYPAVVELAARLKDPFANLFLPASVGCFCYWLLSTLDAEAADKFFTELFENPSGVTLILQRRLVADRMSKRNTRTNEQVALVVKTWNAWRSGESLRLLKFLKDESMPEPI